MTGTHHMTRTKFNIGPIKQSEWRNRCYTKTHSPFHRTSLPKVSFAKKNGSFVKEEDRLILYRGRTTHKYN